MNRKTRGRHRSRVVSLILIAFLVSLMVSTSFVQPTDAETKTVTVPAGKLIYAEYDLRVPSNGVQLYGNISTGAKVLRAFAIIDEYNLQLAKGGQNYTCACLVKNIGTNPLAFLAQIPYSGSWYVILDNRDDATYAKTITIEYDWRIFRSCDGYHNLPSAYIGQWIEYKVINNTLDMRKFFGGHLTNATTGSTLRFEILNLTRYAWWIENTWIGGYKYKFYVNATLSGNRIYEGMMGHGIFGLFVLPPSGWAKISQFLDKTSLGTTSYPTANTIEFFVPSIQKFYWQIFECIISWDGNITLRYQKNYGVLVGLNYTQFGWYELPRGWVDRGVFKLTYFNSSTPISLPTSPLNWETAGDPKPNPSSTSDSVSVFTAIIMFLIFSLVFLLGIWSTESSLTELRKLTKPLFSDHSRKQAKRQALW